MHQISSADGAEACAQVEILGATIKIECGHIRRRLLLNRGFFARRKLGLQLIRNCLGDFTLDGEDVGQVAVVRLGPEMCVISRID